MIAFLNAHHIAIGMTSAMIAVPPDSTTGLGVEGYVDPTALTAAVNAIAAAGGTLSFINMDGPLFYGHVDTGQNAEQGSIATIAGQVATSLKAIQAVFPNVQVMDAEGPANAPIMAAWLAAFKAATGILPTAVNVDINSSIAGWQSQTDAFAAVVRAAGVEVDVSIDSPSTQQSNQAWVLSAEQTMAAIAADPLIDPSDYTVASWGFYPTETLPEGDPDSLMHVAEETALVTPLYESGAITGNAGVATTLAFSANDGAVRTVFGVTGEAVALPGISLSAAGTPSAGTTFGVVVTAISGTLAATSAGAGAVGGSGTTAITLVGDLSDINAELASLSYTGTAAGADTLDVTLYGGSGLIADQDLTVSVAAPVTVTPAAGTTVTAATVAQAQSTITSLLADLTDATPAAATVTTWTAALVNGESLAAIRTALSSSAPVVATLNTMWTGLYGAAPTLAQLAGLESQLAGGQTLDDVMAPLITGSAAESQVSSLYTGMLGVAPGTNDLLSLTTDYLLGESLKSISTALSQSDAVTLPLENLYQCVYGAAPTATQLAAMQAQIAAGGSLAAEEAQLDTVAQQEITQTYEEVYNLVPSASEVATDAAGIESGRSLGSYRAEFAESPLENSKLAWVYQNFVGVAASPQMVVQLQYDIAGPLSLNDVKQDLTNSVSFYKAIENVAPTEADVTSVLNLYIGGWTSAQIEASIASSPASEANLTAAYQADFRHAPSAAVMTSLVAQLGTSSLTAVESSLASQAAADKPVLSGMPSGETLPDTAQTLPLRSLVLSDPDPLQDETAIVTLSGAVGKLAGGGGTVSANGETFTTITGTASFIDTFLQGMTFYPTAGVSGSAKLTVSVTNTIGHTTTATTTITTDTASGGAGENYVFFSTGNDTIAAPAMNDIFVETGKPWGNDVISGFNPAKDMLQLSASAFANLAHVQAATTSAAGAAVIRLDATDSITLPGIAPSQLTSSNIQLV